MDKEIVAQFQHGKYGTFMFKLCAKWTKFLRKHRWLYYLLACTWGFIATFLGVLLTGILGIAKIFNKNIVFRKYHWIYSISLGPDYWGGFEMGLMFVRDQKSWEALEWHEFGHTFQNCLFGPFMLFLVSIPSAIRWWYQWFRTRKGKENKAYDAMWFEDSASCCGKYVRDYLVSDCKR